MREVNCSQIAKTVAELCVKANMDLPKDVCEAFKRAMKDETSATGREIFRILLENADIARKEQIAYCQDTGFAVVFVEMGQDVHITGGFLEDAINEGVRKGYKDGYLRKSVVADPLDRRNTGDNTPAVVHVKIVPGDAFHITIGPKGFGSENMSKIKMLEPTMGPEGVKEFVVQVVKEAGGNPCPPVIVGIGLGGTFEKAALLAKQALLRDIGKYSEKPHIAKLEKELLELVNKTNVGPQGLGGKYTALAVHIETYPTHIAGLPVAVNICCHASRHASASL
jgi:fumarate hydratase subunit alpha